jgi:membrane-bound lytic murein transglycosylase B
MTLLNLERAKRTVLSSQFPVFSYCREKIKKQINKSRLASFVLVAAMVPIAVAPVAAPKAVLLEDYKSHIVMNTTKADLLEGDIKTVQIVPGESQTQKADREKAEADAKAKVDAEMAKLALVSRNTVTRERRVYSDPSNFDEIYIRAQNVTGVDARILKAIHQVETGGSGSTGLTNHSGSGATGPMQFLPSTWRRHGVDGNGDGIADINNVEDAIFSAATYLNACGYPNVKKALWGYNPSTSYYNKVMRIAGM